VDLGSTRVGPFVNVLYSKVSLASYVEQGAAVGDALIPESDYDRTESSVGFEAAFPALGSLRPSVRVAYTHVDEGGDSSALLTLAAVPGSAQSIALPASDDDFASAQLTLEADWAGFGWRAALEARGTDNETSGRFILGVAKTF